MSEKNYKNNLVVIDNQNWESRVAVLEEGVLQDLYFDRREDPAIEKGFIKGVVSKILPGIQTVFIEIGMKKSGYLHISEVDKSSISKKISEENSGVEDVQVRKKFRAADVSVGSLFVPNQEVLVQVKKEAYQTKGAKLTTNYTLPGKFTVLMPGVNHIGVSSKIASKQERSRLREILDEILPEGYGAIIRTDAEGHPEQDLKKDALFLVSTWEKIQQKFKSAKVGEMVHSDFPLAVRTIREHFDGNEETTVVCNNDKDVSLIKDFAQKFIGNSNFEVVMIKNKDLFEHFGITDQINRLLKKQVELKSGGNIVIEYTEALTVIDVNSSKFVGKKNQEETTLKINLEAAKEVVRQLRLRNVGGIIVIDFIDMHHSSSKNTLMNLLQEELRKKDKLKSTILKISELGIVQMTRKRSGKSLEQQLTKSCAECHGLGIVKSDSTISFEVLRSIKFQLCLSKEKLAQMQVTVSPMVFDFISQKEFSSILDMEKEFGVKIVLLKDQSFGKDKHTFLFKKAPK